MIRCLLLCYRKEKRVIKCLFLVVELSADELHHRKGIGKVQDNNWESGGFQTESIMLGWLESPHDTSYSVPKKSPALSLDLVWRQLVSIVSRVPGK